jgi:hypothetical protein
VALKVIYKLLWEHFLHHSERESNVLSPTLITF